MPLLDVSDVLFDPDFADALVCERSVTTTGADGFATRQATTLPFIGVVTSSGGDLLDRLAEGRQRHGSITIHTRTALYAGKDSTDADIVTYAGQRYTVTNVNDYSRYGRGFYAAECELLALT